MSRKIEALVRNRYGTPAAPGPRKVGRVYRGFIKPEVIEGARSYLSEHREALDEARAKYGVPKEIIVSILLVETRLGEYVGKKSAFNTLASMARCSDMDIIRPYVRGECLLPKHEEFACRKLGEKSNWAYRELKALIVYADQAGLDPVQIPGSFYGAIGICQFMPSHAMNFGVDADKDGRVDLFSRRDAFHSMANYLKGHGWKSRMSRERKFKVIRAYNASNTYANTILAVADKLTVKNMAKRPANRKVAPINPA
jgi:membrane-bound lytic murein transglycosylase B